MIQLRLTQAGLYVSIFNSIEINIDIHLVNSDTTIKNIVDHHQFLKCVELRDAAR